MLTMKAFKVLSVLAVTVSMLTVEAFAKVEDPDSGLWSDLVTFGPASNPGGLVGYIQAFETNATEFFPAFLPTSANVPNNIGVQLYEDPTQTLISDQLWTQGGFWYFASDPSLIDFSQNGITLVGGLVEDGTLQDVSSFFLLPPGSMAVSSDPVPEPSSSLFLALGGLLIFLKQRFTR
jgi:hypothetical protein